MGVRILNNSWGGGAFSETLYDAIEYANEKGVLFVAAAGNDGVNTDIYPDYPASFDLPNIISVAASDQSDQRALWGRGGGGDDCGFVCSNAMAVTPGSNYGPKTVDLGAPGKEIYSTVPGNRYLRLTGTSMAAPHVAGVSGLLLARYPDLIPQQVKQRLLGAVDVVAAFEGITVSGGRLNAAAALQDF
jgi:subtilisin family serine protease